jgi:hypothetical protein
MAAGIDDFTHSLETINRRAKSGGGGAAMSVVELGRLARNILGMSKNVIFAKDSDQFQHLLSKRRGDKGRARSTEEGANLVLEIWLDVSSFLVPEPPGTTRRDSALFAVQIAQVFSALTFPIQSYKKM